MKRIITMIACMYCAGSFATTDERILDCSKLAHGADRLACYDRIARSLTVADNKPAVEQNTAPKVKAVTPVAVTPKAEPTKEVSKRFGLEHKKTEQEKATESIEVTISKVKASGYDRWTLWFDNEQQWKTIAGTRIKFKPGQEVEIKRGVFNSFLLSIKGQNRSVKVKRIN